MSIAGYEAEWRERLASDDVEVAWAAYAEGNEWFDGEQEITESARSWFFAEHKKGKRSW